MNIATVMLSALAITACSLDASSKPICVVEEDCTYAFVDGVPVRDAHCIQNVCVLDAPVNGTPDVFYVQGTTRVAEGDVLANDTDLPVDRAAEIKYLDDPGPGSIELVDPRTVRITAPLTDLPVSFGYQRADYIGVTSNDEPIGYIPITVELLPFNIAAEVSAGGTASLSGLLRGIAGATADTVEVTPPTIGTLTGQFPDLVYTADGCTADSVTLTFQATNGSFEVPVMIAAVLPLVDDFVVVEFGRSTVVDVLGNDEVDGLTITSVLSPHVTITPDGHGLVVDPPVGVAGVQTLTYTARDAAGCSGTATAYVRVESPTTVLVGAGITGDSFDPVPSADGRYVAFSSAESTLVANDTNGEADVFVLDMETSAIERVSVTSGGAQANGASAAPSISADGRWIAFSSRATNLASQDTTATDDIYLHDRLTHTTTLVSINIDGAGSDLPSITPHVADDGNRIVFASSATRLILADTNESLDAFVRDVAAGSTTRIAPHSDARPRISGNGRYVAVYSSASLDSSNRIGVFVVDLAAQTSTHAGVYGVAPELDDSGRFVAYSNSPNTWSDLYIVDRTIDVTSDVADGTFPAMSASGRYTSFATTSGVSVWNGTTATNVIVNRNDMPIAGVEVLRRPELSADGRWVVFATAKWPGHIGQYVIVRVWNRAYVGP